jgi:plastocyanin
MRIPLLHSAATVAVVAVLAAGCGGGSGGGGSSAAASSPPANAQVVEIDVAQSGFAFTKTTATASAGTVELKSMNPQSVSHDISIKGNGVDEHGNLVSGGGVSTVTADLKPGTYTFYCSVPGHEQAGMKGTLTVS